MKFKLDLTYENEDTRYLRQRDDLTFRSNMGRYTGWDYQFMVDEPIRFRNGSNITMSDVTRTVSFQGLDVARPLTRSDLEQIYPRQSETILSSAARTESERREAQRLADRARLEEERRNRPFWERATGLFR